MNITKLLLAGVIALFASSNMFAGVKCCDAAKAAGKECEHPCCVKAKPSGKPCKKCSRPTVGEGK